MSNIYNQNRVSSVELVGTLKLAVCELTIRPLALTLINETVSDVVGHLNLGSVQKVQRFSEKGNSSQRGAGASMPDILLFIRPEHH